MVSSVTTLSQSQIQSLLQAETKQLEKPITNWQNQIKTDQAKVSAWGKIGGAMSSLDSALSAIQNPGSLNDRSATSSNAKVATVTAQRGSAVGNYQLTNVQQASAQSIYSSTYASETAAIGGGAGTLTFTLASGQTQTVSVTSGQNTLNRVVAAINATTDGSVRASIVGGSTGYRLVLTGTSTGSQSAFTVSGTGSLAELSYSATAPGAFILASSAADASMDINGVPISNATNTFTNAIPGATVALAGAGSANLAVSASDSALSGVVSSVVGKLNAAIQAVQTQTKFAGTGSSSPNGLLLGNFSASDLVTRMDGAIASLVVDGQSSAMVGITMNKDGTLTFDAGAFKKAYASDPTAVEDLASRLYTQVKSVTQAAVGSSVTGTVAEHKSALGDTIKNLNAEISQKTTFIDAQINNLANDYSAMRGAQSKYSTWNRYLNAIFGGSSSNE